MNKKKLTLGQPATYQIKVPGALDVEMLDWNDRITAVIETDESNPPVTVLTTTVDQAALQGLLQYLYSLGLPLISAVWIDLPEK